MAGEPLKPLSREEQDGKGINEPLGWLHELAISLQMSGLGDRALIAATTHEKIQEYVLRALETIRVLDQERDNLKNEMKLMIPLHEAVAEKDKAVARCLAQQDTELSANYITITQAKEREARLVEALRPFAECNREWMENGKRAEIRFDWLGKADEILREIEKEKGKA